MNAETQALQRGLDAYQDTLARIEPEIAMIDPGAFHASAAISLKRIADALEGKAKPTPAAEEDLAPITSIQKNVITLGDLREMLNRATLPDTTPVVVMPPGRVGQAVKRVHFETLSGADEPCILFHY